MYLQIEKDTSQHNATVDEIEAKFDKFFKKEESVNEKEKIHRKPPKPKKQENNSEKEREVRKQMEEVNFVFFDKM